MRRPLGKPDLSAIAPVRAPMRKRLESLPYDVADEFKTAADVVYFLEAALELDDPGYFQKALGTAARAHGMQQVARATGATRAGLYKALSERGNPEFGTVMRVLDAIGLRLTLKPRRASRGRVQAGATVGPNRRRIPA